jgi:hypothetical protein
MYVYGRICCAYTTYGVGFNVRKIGLLWEILK